MMKAAVAAMVALMAPGAARAEDLTDSSLGLTSTHIEAPAARPAAVTTDQAEAPPEVAADPAAARVDPSPLTTRSEPIPFFSAETTGAVDKAVRPAYRAIERLSDGVYDLLRRQLIGRIMPGGLSRGLAPSPESDSYAAYKRELANKEDRYAQRLLDSYRRIKVQGQASPQQLSDWQSWAREEQVSVAIDSFRDALLERHQLEEFGRFSGDYARNRSHWDPGFLTMSSLIGSAFLYLNGLHASGSIGDLRVALDLRSGQRWLQGLSSGGQAGRLAGLEVGWRGKPVTLAADWGMSNGRLIGQRVGLNYRLRY